MVLHLSDECLSPGGGAVAAVDVAVAVHTRPGEHLVRRTGPLKSFKTSVGCAGVPGSVVTALAELGRPADEEFVMIAAVRSVASQAIFLHRGMRPHPGASLVGMAFVTKLVDRIPFQLSRAEPPVVFMAAGALHFSLPDGMMGGPVLLGADALVAEVAEVRLGGL